MAVHGSSFVVKRCGKFLTLLSVVALGTGVLKLDSLGIGFGSSEASVTPLNYPSADELLTLFVNEAGNAIYYNAFGVHEDAFPAGLAGVDTFSFGPAGTLNWMSSGKVGSYYTFAALSDDVDFMQGPGKTTGLNIEFDTVDVQALSFKLLQDAYFFDSFEPSGAPPQRVFISGSVLDYGDQPIPSPATFMLLGAGILGAGLARRKYRQQAKP